MKQIFSVLVFVLFLTTIANAQTEKGAWMLGGGLELTTAKDNSRFNLYPNAGYFFLKNFAAGAYVQASLGKTGGQTDNEFFIGPFARYYFGKNTIRPFVHGGFGFGSRKLGDGSVSGTSFDLAGGLAAFVTDNIAVETQAGYYNVKYDDSNGGFRLKVGFQIYLDPKKIVSTIKNR